MTADQKPPEGTTRRSLLGTALLTPLVISAPAVLAATPAIAATDPGPACGTDVGGRLAQLRFGMFVHFNPSSVVGKEIGWGRQAKRFGESPGNYKDSANWPDKDPKYDGAYQTFLPKADWATKLVATAKSAGMRYLVFTTKHHDGYPNFRARNVSRSAYSDYATTPLGKSGRDLTKEIADATRAAGLKIGFYYSPRDWTQPDYVKAAYGTYFDYMMEHLEQLLGGDYGKVDFLWYDSIPYADRASFRPPLLLSRPRELQPGILINDRAYSNMGFQAIPTAIKGQYATPEQKVGAFDVFSPWESCLTITPPNWSYNVPAIASSDATTVLKSLMDTATGDGNLLLNVPPMETGYLAPAITSTLNDVGAWMSKNGAGIIGTRGGPFKNTSTAGVTYRDRTVYVHLSVGTNLGRVVIPRLQAKITGVLTMSGAQVPFTDSGTGPITIDLKRVTEQPDKNRLVLQVGYDRPITREYVTDSPVVLVTNLARGKATRQHSTAFDGASSLAVDGNRDGVYYNRSVTHTAEDANQAWWEVDLGSVVAIGDVVIYNRTDRPYGDRLKDFWVMASATPFPATNDLTASRTAAGVIATKVTGLAGATRTVTLSGSRRYVRIQLEANATPLSLAEVEVYPG